MEINTISSGAGQYYNTGNQTINRQNQPVSAQEALNREQNIESSKTSPDQNTATRANQAVQVDISQAGQALAAEADNPAGTQAPAAGTQPRNTGSMEGRAQIGRIVNITG
ncbi:MAG: hypothetical protein U9P10_05930 [Thermodesulfobacteriota bacterium]|nr:hypothetical protein [Thermodesulfobacteriota bacterium]